MSLQRRAAPQSSEQSLCSLTEAYAVFGVQEGASLQALKRSYHALALRHHPDKQGAASDPATFNRIKAAYEQLLNSPLANLDRSTSVAASDIDAKAQAAFEELERRRDAREVQEQQVAEQRRRATENARASHGWETLGDAQAFKRFAFGNARAVLFDNVVYTRSDVVDRSLPASSGRKGEEDVWVSAEDSAAHIRREYRSDLRCWAWVLTLATGCYTLPAGTEYSAQPMGCSPMPWNSQGRDYMWASWWHHLPGRRPTRTRMLSRAVGEAELRRRVHEKQLATEVRLRGRVRDPSSPRRCGLGFELETLARHGGAA